MKLSLDELKVDSYDDQRGETDLAQVKGGTSVLCAQLGVAVATSVYNLWKNSGSGSGGNSGSGVIILDLDSARTYSGGSSSYRVDSVAVR